MSHKFLSLLGRDLRQNRVIDLPISNGFCWYDRDAVFNVVMRVQLRTERTGLQLSDPGAA
jgi:hypothetical protein